MFEFLKKKPDQLNTGEAIAYVVIVGTVCYIPVLGITFVIDHSEDIATAIKKALRFCKNVRLKIVVKKDEEEA